MDSGFRCAAPESMPQWRRFERRHSPSRRHPRACPEDPDLGSPVEQRRKIWNIRDKPKHDEPQEAASLSAQTWIALIHNSPASCYGVSFPDLPGIITAADTLDEALARAAEVLAFAFEDWQPPAPRGLDALRLDAEFVEGSEGAIVAGVSPAPQHHPTE
jgi:predicted RNase H-like HicB family nuclease